MPRDRLALRRAIPHLLTLGNGFCGLGGLLVLTGDGDRKIAVAAALIFIGWLFDMVDGIAARRLGTEGAFGAALDNVCDAVTFGALPAVLVVAYCGHDGVAIAGALLYGAATLLRLARYAAALLHRARYMARSIAVSTPRQYFAGLPSPAAAMMLAIAVLLPLPPWLVTATAGLTAIAMVSTLPYADVPYFYTSRRWPVWSLLGPAIFAVSLGETVATATVLGVYLLSGPILGLVRRTRKP